MTAYEVGIHFHFLGPAREKLGDKVIQIPCPSTGLGLYPCVGDAVKVPGFDSFSFQVVAREFRFEVGGLHVDCYLDSVAHDLAPPNLTVVK